MPRAMIRFLRSVLLPVAGPAGWVVVAGPLVVAALWASEPGGADPPASSWKAGRTIATWDWEQHWNHWMEWLCSDLKTDAYGEPSACLGWLPVGPTWKRCGPRIQPPDPERTNTCNIGQAGGHGPHGDGRTEKYTYLGQHEDRTGPTYLVCDGDRSLPADTSPGNCGTWVTIPHAHCPRNRDAHPPDCPSTTGGPPSSGSSSTGGPSSGGPSSTGGPSSDGPSSTGGPPSDGPFSTGGPSPTQPPEPSGCEEPGALEAFFDAVEDRPTPGLGLQPTANGFVRVPMRAFYTHNPRVSLSSRIDGDRVALRLWVAKLSWSFTDLGTLTGSDLGRRTFHRYARDRRDARSLTSPVTVTVNGARVVYRMSSTRGGLSDRIPRHAHGDLAGPVP